MFDISFVSNCRTHHLFSNPKIIEIHWNAETTLSTLPTNSVSKNGKCLQAFRFRECSSVSTKSNSRLGFEKLYKFFFLLNFTFDFTIIINP